MDDRPTAFADEPRLITEFLLKSVKGGEASPVAQSQIGKAANTGIGFSGLDVESLGTRTAPQLTSAVRWA